jgi:predicted acylesterase/phospholipase RssA
MHKSIKQKLAGLKKNSSKPRKSEIWEFNPDEFTDFIRHRKNKKFVVALSSGKLKIACHLPFLSLIEKLDMKIDELYGVSAGAIVGGLWASGLSIKQLDDALDDISLSLMFDLFNVKAIKSEISVLLGEEKLKTAGFFPGMKVENHIRELAQKASQPNPLVNLSDFHAIAYNIERYQKTILSITNDGNVRHLMQSEDDLFDENISDGDLADILRASMSMSGIYWPKQIGDEYYLDGGIAEHLPIRTPFIRWLEDVNMRREKRDLLIVAMEVAYWSKDSSPPTNPLSLISESFEILGVELSVDHEFIIKDYKTTRGPKADLIIIRPKLPYVPMTEIPDFDMQITESKKAILEELADNE